MNYKNIFGKDWYINAIKFEDSNKKFFLTAKEKYNTMHLYIYSSSEKRWYTAALQKCDDPYNVYR